MKEITGKKRIVVDDDIFLDFDRTPDGQFSSATNFLGASYIPSAANKDTLRAALGKNWDYDFPETQQAIAGGTKIFKNDNTKLNIFCDTPLSIDYCESPIDITGEDNHPISTRQHIVLECNVSEEKFQNTFSSNAYFNPEVHTAGVKGDGFGDTIFWAFLMQYGVVTPSNQTLMPLVKTYSHQDSSINGIEFFDHYHEAIAPYTPSELANQETAGKAFYVDYETYYNSRISTPGVGSQGYEDFIGSVSDYQNCLPNIYAFTKIAESNNFAEDGFFNIDKIVKGPNPFASDITFKDYYQQELLPWPWNVDETHGYAEWILINDAYVKLFKYYPLEASALLYGSMAGLDRNIKLPDKSVETTPAEIALPENPTIQQLLKLDAKTTDTTSLFARWFENFKRVLSEDSNFAVRKMNSPNWPDERGPAPSTKLGGLEYINSNLAFSHNTAVSLLNKADQYKKHFPMYFELNFTAKQATQLGDSIKNLKMGKFFSSLAAAQHPTRLVPGGYYQKEYLNPDQSLPFIDFVETSVYETLFDPADPGSGKAVFITIPAMDAPAWVANDKTSVDLLQRLESFADGSDYSSAVVQPLATTDSPAGSNLADPANESTLSTVDIYQYYEYASNSYTEPGLFGIGIRPTPIHSPGPLFRHDLRNHMAYVRNDADEPPSLDPDCNALFKGLGTAAFRQRLIEIYNEKRRTYEDILEGVPAYTEDLFYVITKFRKDINSSEEEVVQNIIIPNTSDLNIVNYIDTQVKYGAHATYRYEVFAHRVVFGSRYRYDFRTTYQKANDGNIGLVDLSSATQNESDYTQNPLQLLQTHGETGYVNGAYTANYNVEVHPSIKLVVDKIFSTPEVKILDRPPVAPDVNVVPYRAVNDKIRIMLCGQTDKYREEPVIILDEDEQSFKQLMESQFSHDNKVEFSSDDRIAGFEVFRVEDRPSSYSDFLLHPDSDIAIVDGFSVAFDDAILPNKKYYYTFRARDAHGHVSNPSAVYEIELIDEKGAVKPLIRTISMEKKENKISTKECQKYILLRPTHNQLHFSSDNNPDINSVFTTDQTSGKKKYKMRLTSKGTGKKIDINFSFFKDFSED